MDLHQKLTPYLKRFLRDARKITLLGSDRAGVSEVYKVDSSCDISPYVVKVFDLDCHYNNEKRALELLQSTGRVPQIIGAISPSDSLRGAILMEYVQGFAVSSIAPNNFVAGELGRFIAYVHMVSQQSAGSETRNSALRYFEHKFEESLSESARRLPLNLVDACRFYYQRNVHALCDLVGSACFVHGDLHLDNIIFDGSRVVVIDWASAHYGFAEEDIYAFEMTDWGKTNSFSAFLEGYSSVKPLRDHTKTKPLFAMAKLLAIIGWIVKARASELLYQKKIRELEELVASVE